MQTLYMTTAGSSDPTRASIPLHLAVNGSLEVGHDVGVILAGDATELLKSGVRDSVEGGRRATRPRPVRQGAAAQSAHLRLKGMCGRP